MDASLQVEIVGVKIQVQVHVGISLHELGVSDVADLFAWSKAALEQELDEGSDGLELAENTEDVQEMFTFLKNWLIFGVPVAAIFLLKGFI